jgi:hypothetical protein
MNQLVVTEEEVYGTRWERVVYNTNRMVIWKYHEGSSSNLQVIQVVIDVLSDLQNTEFAGLHLVGGLHYIFFPPILKYLLSIILMSMPE